MITPLISPTEPDELQAALRAISSSLPETKGSDILLHFYILDKPAIAGIQRKVIPGDFIASVADGRLSKELMQMRETDLTVKILLLEGRLKYDENGKLIMGRYPTRYTREQIENMLLSIQVEHGLIIQTTDNTWGTVRRILEIQEWLNKKDHNSFRYRHNSSKPQDWHMQPPEEERIAWWMQGIPGVGPQTAKDLVAVFKRPVDLLTAELEDLVKVPGIGKGTASKILSFLRQEKV